MSVKNSIRFGAAFFNCMESHFSAAIKKVVNADRSIDVDTHPIVSIPAVLAKPTDFVAVDSVIKQSLIDHRIATLMMTPTIASYLHTSD